MIQLGAPTRTQFTIVPTQWLKLLVGQPIKGNHGPRPTVFILQDIFDRENQQGIIRFS